MNILVLAKNYILALQAESSTEAKDLESELMNKLAFLQGKIENDKKQPEEVRSKLMQCVNDALALQKKSVQSTVNLGKSSGNALLRFLDGHFQFYPKY